MKAKRLFLLIVLGLFVTTAARAQAPYHSVPGTGLAGGGAAYVQGIDAIYYNPANMVLDNRSRTSTFSLAQFGAWAGGGLVRFDLYNTYLTGGTVISNAEMEQMLDQWFGDGDRSVRVGANMLLAGLTISRPSGDIGAALRLRSSMLIGANRGIFRAMTGGLGNNGQFPVDGEFRSFSSVDLSVAYSRDIPNLPLTVGVAPKFVFGLDHTDAWLDSDVTVADTLLQHTFDYRLRTAGLLSGVFSGFTPFSQVDIEGPSPGLAGFGVGVDVGGRYQLRDDLVLAASITDLGTIRWSEGARTVKPANNTFRFDGIEYNADRIDSEFGGNLGDYVTHVLDSLASNAYANTETTESPYFSSLPTAFHVGAQYSWWKLRVVGGIDMGLARVGGNIITPGLNTGAELRLGGDAFAFPLRLGLRFGGQGAMRLGMGFGIHTSVYDFDLGTAFTPTTSFMGGGAEYVLGTAVLTIRI